MNYKTIILLLALFFIILLIYREIYNLNIRLQKNEEQQKKEHDYFLNNVNKCLNDFTQITMDNFNQFKTIATLNQQLANKKTMNGFTETTGEKLSIYSDSEPEQELYMSSDAQTAGSILEQAIDIDDDREKAPRVPPKMEKTKEYQNIKNVKDIHGHHNQFFNPFIMVPAQESQDICAEICGNVPFMLNPFIAMTNTLSHDIADIFFVNDMESNDAKSSAKIEEIFDNDQKKIPNNKIQEIKQDQEINKTQEIQEIQEIKQDQEINKTQEIQEIQEIKQNPNVLKSEVRIKPKKLLKDIDEYNITELRSMSKKYSLPINIKQNNKMRFYKKDELYQNIKQYLSSS